MQSNMLMNFRMFPVLLVLLAPAILGTQAVSIAQARALPEGTSVTVCGIVVNGSELGRMRYLQDGTAGIAVFPASGSAAGFERATTTGDSLEVTGKLLLYNNLLEISPVESYKILQRKHVLPSPRISNLKALGPDLESQRVQINSVCFTDRRDTFTSNSSFEVMDAKGYKAKVFIQKNSPLVGRPVPDQPFPLIAILSRYQGFQLLPLNLEEYVPKEKLPGMHLDSSEVTTNLQIENCDAGKISVKDKAGKEWLYALAHSSGTTRLSVADLPPGDYVAEVHSHGQVIILPFKKS